MKKVWIARCNWENLGLLGDPDNEIFGVAETKSLCRMLAEEYVKEYADADSDLIDELRDCIDYEKHYVYTTEDEEKWQNGK